jgi:alcohol dehydrogenase (cytochrome c)
VAFAIDGKEYITVTTGLGGGSPRDVPRVSAPEIHYPGNGNALYVFSLGEGRWRASQFRKLSGSQ